MAIVKLIEYPGSGHSDPWYAAKLLIYTKSTRLSQGEETRAKIFAMPPDQIMKELMAVAMSVRSSWEVCSNYVFEIRRVTRACANQMTRTRYGVSFAQEAMRVADMSNFEADLPQSVVDAGMTDAWEALVKTIQVTYRRLREAGVPAQDARGILPLNTYTSLVARYDLRAMADMMAKRDNLRAQGEYAQIARDMKEAVYHVHPWAKLFLEPDRQATPTLDKMIAEKLNGASPVDKPILNEALKELDKVKAVWG